MVEEAYRDKGLIILIKSIFDQLDEIASLKAESKSAKISFTMLKEMSKILPELNKEDINKYYELLILLSESVKPPTTKSRIIDKDFLEGSIPAKQKTISEIKRILKVA